MKHYVVGVRRPSNPKLSLGKDMPSVCIPSMATMSALLPATLEQVFAGSK